MTDTASIAAWLSEAQKKLVLASDPDDITGEEGCGVSIRGSQYKTARKLERLGLGYYSHGSPFGDLYCNNSFGLSVRAFLEGKEG